MKPTHYLLLALVVLLAACAAPPPAPEEPAQSSMPALTDPTQPILVKAGETFFIVVESNPTTGYHWEIVGDLNGVELVSREYTAGEPVIPGSSGVEVWIFKAVSAGETTLVLGSFPPGESTTAEQELQFTITVQ